MLNQINLIIGSRKFIVYVGLIVAILLAYSQAIQFDFVYIDDDFYVFDNINIQSGITMEGIRWAFGAKYYYWHPLTWLSFMFDYQLQGLNAGVYHVTNILLHIFSSLLLFGLFERMTKDVWKSAFVAALFALHPLHVESVAWISERKDVLSAFFWMLTLYFYVYYTEKPVVKRYLVVLFFFILALMSKPMVITIPVIMILLDYWPLSRFQIGIESKKENILLWQLKEKAPFFILSLIVVILTLNINKNVEQFSLYSRLSNALVSFVIYLNKTFFPQDMAVLYPFSEQIPGWQVSGAILLIVVISTAAIIAVRKLPCLFVGWFWYATTLLPVIGIIQVNHLSMADRYHYLPSIGIAIILAWGIPSLIKSEILRKKILFPAGITFMIIMTGLTYQQCSYWKNSTELCKYALTVTKNNSVLHNCLACGLATEGKFEEAVYHFQRAIILKPYETKYYNNRGFAYENLGDNQRAINDYSEAIRLNKNNSYAYRNRGNIYYRLGDYQLAIADYNQCLNLKPYDIDTYYNRGIIHGKLGQYRQAIDNFSDVIRLKPSYTEAYNNRGFAYLLQGDKEHGCHDMQKACAMGICVALEKAKKKGYCL